MHKHCREEGCVKPIKARGWCSKHYQRWREYGDPNPKPKPPRLCNRQGCEQIHYGKGLCRQHYRDEYNKTNAERLAEYEQKRKQDPKRKAAELKRQQGRRSYLASWQRRPRMPYWAAWWEEQRRQEDIYDIGARLPVLWTGPRIVKGKATIKGKAAIKISQGPKTRQFIAGFCIVEKCGEAWIDYAGRANGSRYCQEHARIRQKRPGSHRAKTAGVDVIHPIIPEHVFNRDGWRCHICGRKTKGKVPNPRAPTLDHLIPIACGGSHTYANLRCACFRCNSIKGSKAVDDQLILFG
jgi:HNH endonuclease